MSPQISGTEPAQTHNYIIENPLTPLALGRPARHQAEPGRRATRYVPMGSSRSADVAAACSTAVAAWFDRARWAAVAVWLAAAVAGTQHAQHAQHAEYAQTLPRPAALEGALALPGMRRLMWLRLVRLVTVRAEREFGQARPGPAKRIADCADTAEAEPGAAAVAQEQWRRELTTKGVRNMVGYLTSNAGADEAGRIPNTGRLIASYAKWHGCREETAYKHWRAVRELGLVRQTQHSAPGEHARYVLCFPPAQLPTNIPTDDISPNPANLAAYVDTWAQQAGEALDAADELELVRYGSCRSTRTLATTTTGSGNTDTTSADTGPHLLGAYYCQAFPLYAKARTTPPSRTGQRRNFRSTKQRGGKISSEEQDRARSVLSACRARWLTQRGADRMPSDAELDRVVPLLAITLRHTHRSEIVELLACQVGSAQSLPSVLLWRLGRTLQTLRRAYHQPVDDDGAIYNANRARHAAQAAEQHTQTAQARQRAREQMQAGRARANARYATQRHKTTGLGITLPTTPGEPTPHPQLIEPETTFTALNRNPYTTDDPRHHYAAAADRDMAADLTAAAERAHHHTMPAAAGDVVAAFSQLRR